jgi:uncharacterized protein YkwD
MHRSPRFLLAIVLTTAAVTAAAPLAHTAARSSADSAARTMLTEINAVRSAHGLKPLQPSRQLTRAAVAHARSMAARGYFAHDAPGGQCFIARMRAYFSLADTVPMAENIAWASGPIELSAFVRMWMQSPPHRLNILAADFREVGIGLASREHAPGIYGGRNVRIAVADFAG